MKKLLPIFFSVVFFLTTLFSPQLVAAQTQLQAPTPIAVPTGGLWIVDPEVTFIGKNAARSGLMLDWTLQNYNWVCVTRIANRQCDDRNNPLAQFWGQIVLYIVVPLLFFVILATAAVIIITRGKSLTIMRFIPRFVAVIILIVFSYSLLQFFYQFFDLIQGFFLQSQPNAGACPPNCISQKDLLYVGWDYRAFIGLRLLGDYNAESAFISLLLTKLTALTYFVMVGILLMRKIILWFFIIVSPIFPLLLLYYPVRNTGKIWIGEFFRWLLYAPLFAIFLKGLVSMWRSQIPLVFDNPNIGNASQIVFPTAVNILLGGPRQFVTPTNSVNLTETFALYVVALIMLWIVILLPWILLQIFLDYAANFAPGDSAVMKTLVNLMGNKKVPPPPGGQQPPEQPGGTGMTLNLPFSKKFNVPVSVNPTYKPTGAAKEIERSTIESRFAQPISLPNAQVNAQAMNLANVTIPSMRDIAKYETAMLSRDSSQKKEVSQMTQTLEKIANPVAVTSTVEREKYVEIREKVTNEAQQGNLVATSIMNAVNAVSNKNAQATSSQVKSVLTQIANPASSQSPVNREKLSKLHEMLSKESKENNNELASSLLSVTDKSTSSEIEKIQEKLTEAVQQGSSMASSVMSSINNSAQHAQNVSQVKNVLQQVSNPAAVKGVDRVKLSKLHEALQKASKDGDEVATAALSVTSKTSDMDIEKLQEKIMQAKQKGSPVATELANMTQKTTNLPAANRVQTVSKADYDAVRDMWKDNYHNLEVPQGMAGTRQDWIKDDIGKIDSIVGLLSSSDQDKVQEGMQQVSDILPFLLVGGFSQTEIIAYLKAKQDAAKDVSQELSADEEEKVGVAAGTGHAEAQKAMEATMEEDSAPAASSASSSTSMPAEDSSPLSNLSSVEQPDVTVNVPAPQVSNDILVMANLKVPKMRDIVKYETSVLKKDKALMEESSKMKEVLERISNPAPIGTGAERDRYEKLRERLVEESQKGNRTADIILAAAQRVTQKADQISANVAEMKIVLRQIANPETVPADGDKDFYTRLHEYLVKEGKESNNQLANKILAVSENTTVVEIDQLKTELLNQRQTSESATKVVEAINNFVKSRQTRTALMEIADPSTIASSKERTYYTKLHEDLTQASGSGNSLAASLLTVKQTASHGDIENLSRQLQEAKQKGDPLATKILSSITDSAVPASNRVQPVSDEDYDEVRKLWEENYRNLPVPTGFSAEDKGRIEWIQADSKQIEETVALLTSGELDKKDEGIKKVAGILPFLLLGGFSFQEMVGYLNAKLDAAKTVITSLQQEEGQKVSVDVSAQKDEQAKTMAAEVKEDEKKA